MNEKHERQIWIVAIMTITVVTLIGLPLGSIAQGPSELNQALAQVRAATAKYHDLETAIEDGFVNVAPAPGVCHGDVNSAVRISYISRPRFIAPEVNALEPEFLNYIPTGDGNIGLVPVAYGNRVFFRDTRPPTTPGYLPGTFVWRQPVIPPYLEIVNAPFSVLGPQSNGPFFEGVWIYLITAHIWAPNPDGMFADLNPNLSCPATE